MNAIVAEGVPCFSGSCSEVYLEKAFTDLGLGPQERLPVAKTLGESALMFLVHPTLTTAEVDKTCEVLRRVMSSDVGLRPSASLCPWVNTTYARLLCVCGLKA